MRWSARKKCKHESRAVHTSGCRRCEASRDVLKTAVLSEVPDTQWREIDPVEELDYAVELGVLTLPAVAIDGKLVFSSLPTAEQLVAAVRKNRILRPDGY
ncbi:MAG: thioredoxin family protein [Ramlibacter sp.]|nr:thioredoxin family protein [Ramlibacter sp.]